MSRAPSDQAVRDRLLSELDTSFFLQAGAGAGKTRILVDRVVELVRRDHAPLRNIVAITFTEKAAGELRARIRTALSKARGRAADTAEQRRLDDALRQVDAAHIETIHAFASSLLKERPFDAGIDPGFEILDALGADLDFTDAWHGWLWREEDPRAQAAIERALRFDMPLDRLREAAQQLSRNRDLDPPRGSPPPPDPHETHAEWLQTAEQLRVDYEQLGSKQAAQPETLVGWLREMPLDDPDELSRLLLTPERTRKPTGRSEVLVALRERWDEFAEQRAAYARSLRAHILNDVLAVLGAFVRDDADRRRREGRLTFEDLLIEARNLLVKSAGARRFFRERYSHILIDEFQDTDPLQAEIVLLLAAEHDTNDWTNATPAPGRLLVVGDPQQAIYRFRRADIDTYTKVRDLFQRAAEANAEGTAETRLSVNFRSRPELIAWYNRTHARVLLADETWPTAQAQHQILEPHREEAGPGVVVVPSAKQEYANLDEAREDEADSVARIIRGMVDGRTDFALLEGRSAELPRHRDPGQQPHEARALHRPARSGRASRTTTTAGAASSPGRRSATSPRSSRRSMIPRTRSPSSPRSSRRRGRPPTRSCSTTRARAAAEAVTLRGGRGQSQGLPLQGRVATDLNGVSERGSRCGRKTCPTPTRGRFAKRLTSCAHCVRRCAIARCPTSWATSCANRACSKRSSRCRAGSCGRRTC